MNFKDLNLVLSCKCAIFGPIKTKDPNFTTTKQIQTIRNEKILKYCNVVSYLKIRRV